MNEVPQEIIDKVTDCVRVMGQETAAHAKATFDMDAEAACIVTGMSMICEGIAALSGAAMSVHGWPEYDTEFLTRRLVEELREELKLDLRTTF